MELSDRDVEHIIAATQSIIQRLHGATEANEIDEYEFRQFLDGSWGTSRPDTGAPFDLSDIAQLSGIIVPWLAVAVSLANTIITLRRNKVTDKESVLREEMKRNDVPEQHIEQVLLDEQVKKLLN